MFKVGDKVVITKPQELWIDSGYLGKQGVVVSSNLQTYVGYLKALQGIQYIEVRLLSSNTINVPVHCLSYLEPFQGELTFEV